MSQGPFSYIPYMVWRSNPARNFIEHLVRHVEYYVDVYYLFRTIQDFPGAEIAAELNNFLNIPEINQPSLH